MRDSNSRPLGPKPSALAIWANPRLDLNWLDLIKQRYHSIVMVPGGRIELPTQGFSGLCSTTELPWHKLIALPLSGLKPGFSRAGISINYCLVGMGGLEPPTSSLSETRSNQLSYMPLSNNLPIQKKQIWLTI